MRTTALLLIAGLTAACTQLPPEQQLIADAAAALGGRDALLAANTLTIEGEGTQWNVGQDMTIDATGQTFTVANYRRAIDLAGGRMRVQLTRTPTFAYFQGQAAQTQTLGVDGDVAYAVAASGAASRGSAQAARDRRAEYFHHPVVLVRAALDPAATVANARTEGSARLVDVTVAGAGPFTLAIDGSGLPSRISSRSAHPNLGDVVNETTFADYAAHDGLQMPGLITTRVDRFKAAELRLGSASVNGSVSDMAAPETVRAAAAPAAPTVNVVPEVVAPGVWLLAGQSHHSALVEFADHLMLIEAPQSEARSLAAIAKARELVPNKPLTQMVSSHHHFDHSTGLRAAVAEGLTVITHEGNAGYYKEAASRPHTINPDALAKAPKPITVETVGDSRVIEDATRRVELYHIAGNPHSDTMLMAYLPKERVLVQVDAFSPGASVNPYAANLLAQIQARKLRVDRIVPLHGTIVPFAELLKAVPGS